MHANRRDWLRATGLSLGAWCGSAPWFSAVAQEAVHQAQQGKPGPACILLWMNGGPSQLETLDPKPDHDNGGPTKAIATKTPGLQLSEHLPQLAQHSEKLAVVRSMSTKEGDHQRATYVARTGRLPQGPIRYPTFGCLAAKELGGPEDLPPLVTINAQTFFNAPQPSGFLGSEYAPLKVGGGSINGDANQVLAVANLKSRVKDKRFDQRWKLLVAQQERFSAQRPDANVRSHLTAWGKARQMMFGRAQSAFKLDDEPDAVAEAYGSSAFGRGCLLARRLVEAGVPFVEVNLPGWDTHVNNFGQMKNLCEPLDQGWSALLGDLEARGMLASTLVVWMGEFGRTPRINASRGRDHYPRAWSAALAGAGTPGGAMVGKTSRDGGLVEERPVNAAQWIATICSRLGLDLTTQNMSNVGRPIRLVDPGVEPVKELL